MLASYPPAVVVLTSFVVTVAILKLAYHWRLARRTARWNRGLPVNRYF